MPRKSATSRMPRHIGWKALMSQEIESALIAAVVALLVAVRGRFVTYSTEHRAMEVKMVEIAVGILQTKPDDNIRPA